MRKKNVGLQELAITILKTNPHAVLISSSSPLIFFILISTHSTLSGYIFPDIKVGLHSFVQIHEFTLPA